MPDIIANIEDLRILCKKRVPKMFYDYVDSGSWSESTYRANTNDFNDIKFRQRVGINVAENKIFTNFLGSQYSMPIGIAPTGLMGMICPNGEIISAKVAENFNIPFCLSTMSIASIEDVASIVSKPFWFQLYVMKDRGFVLNLIERAKKAKCSALILTLDLQIIGQRNRDIKNGLSIPPKITFKNILNIATKVSWLSGMIKVQKKSFGNISGHYSGAKDINSLSRWIGEQFDPSLSWSDVEWIKKCWGGKLIIKGITDPEDAEIAFKCGADAIIVSNHGGRQLDGAISSIKALPKIIEKLGEDREIYFDGGVRSGQDVLKAIALGAKSVFIGRSFLYGLGAGGEFGAKKSIEIIKKELETTMALVGIKNIKDANRNILI
jgi:L-lactate dehydrogenase (cytochrome)